VQCERWFSRQFDRLILPGVDVVGDEKFDKMENVTTKSGQYPALGERTQNFSHRDLNCGIFGPADLRRADFGNARMLGAVLAGARLQGASLGYAELQGADLSAANLQGANLSWAQLQGAHFGSSFMGLLGAAKLQGAALTGAQLQGANLRGAQLQGAILRSAKLQGADLSGAQLQGAELLIAELQGANLRGAQLQGADLLAAKLQGADLSGAQLQGANLGEEEGAELKLALLSDVFLWRAKVANCSDARTTSPKLDAAIELGPKLGQAPEPVPATPGAITDFIERAIADVSGPRKDEVREQLNAGLVADIDLAAIETIWRECAANSEKVEQAEYDRKHADLLRDLVCDATTNRKEIAAGIIRTSYSPDRRVFFTRLARGLLGLDGKECAATKDLSDRDKEGLHKFVSTPAPAN
jgi:uncharacterized protein YjbI with pentapeptide repeats